MTDRIITNNFSSLTSSDGHLTELDPFDLTDCAGDFVDDFDMDAVSDDYYEACCEVLAAIRPEWSLLRDGEVICPVNPDDLSEDEKEPLSEDEKETLSELLATIDVAAILQAHDLTTN